MSQKLFDLIQSLSKNEKGYFKKFASIHSTTNSLYNKLFDEIEGQKTFDEELIKDLLFNDKRETNYYNVVKNYLYNIILKSLRSFHDQKKISYKINNIFTNVEILYRKKLISQCETELKKVKKLIDKNEIFEKAFKYFSWKRKLLALKGFYPKHDKIEEKFYEERQEYRKKESNLETYSHYQFKFFSISIQMGARNNSSDLEKLKKIMTNKYFIDESLILSNRAKIIFLNTKSKYFEVINDMDNFYIYSEKFVNHLNSNEFLIQENVENIINGTYNLLIASAYQKDKENFYKHFNSYNKISKKYSKLCSKEQKNLISFYGLNVLLFFLVYIEDFESAYDLQTVELPLSENEMKGVFKLIHIELLYFIAYIRFSLGKNLEAQDWLNKILDNPTAIFRKDILTYSKLLDLLNHYDLKNFKLVENLLETTSSSLSKLKRTFKFDKCVLTMLSKLLKASTKIQIDKILNNYKNIFLNLKKDRLEITAFEHINVIRWIDLKLAEEE